MKASLILEFKPELTITVACLACLLVGKFVLSSYFACCCIWVLFDAKYKIIFADYCRTESSSSSLILIDANYRVVTREGKFLIRSEQSCLMGSDIDYRCNEFTLTIFHILAPGHDIGQSL